MRHALARAPHGAAGSGHYGADRKGRGRFKKNVGVCFLGEQRVKIAFQCLVAAADLVDVLGAARRRERQDLVKQGFQSPQPISAHGVIARIVLRARASRTLG